MRASKNFMFLFLINLTQVGTKILFAYIMAINIVTRLPFFQSLFPANMILKCIFTNESLGAEKAPKFMGVR